MRRLRVAVVGCGSWGASHARALRDLEEAELVAVSDADPARARSVGSRYGVEWFTDNEELLRRARPDAVVVCTPPSAHAEVALLAIKHGASLLVEKPLAPSSEEALEIVRAAEEGGVKLMVGHIERFNPGVRRVRSYVEERRVGPPVALSSRRTSRHPARSWDIGVVLDLAIHDIDVMRYLLGEEPLKVYAAVASPLGHPHEDYACVMLKFPSSIGLVEASWIHPRVERRLVVACTGGALSLDYLTQQVTVEDPSGSFTPSYAWEEPLKAELRSFALAVLDNSKPEADGVDGYRAVRIAEAAVRSASLGAPVEVSFSL